MLFVSTREIAATSAASPPKHALLLAVTPLRLFELFVLGGAAGMLGSLVGLGGGFLAVPILRIVFSVAPVGVSGAALVMVLANALSASLAYIRQRRVDVRAASLISATGIPASVFGAILVRYIPPVGFDLLYGALLSYLSIDVLRKRAAPREHSLVYRENIPLLLGAGLFMGFSSSFFGIGGGLIAIPALMLLRMHPHAVTATSTFAILLTSPVGVVAHQFEHDIDWNLALPLALGGIVGGQIGPRIARRLSSPRLLTVTAITLLAAAVGLIFRHAM
jgi:uncharacterized protein